MNDKVIQFTERKKAKELLKDIYNMKRFLTSRHDKDCECPYCTKEKEQ